MDGEKKKFKFSLAYLILAFWAVLLIRQLFSAYVQPGQISYSDFKADVVADKIAEVAVGQTLIRGRFKAPPETANAAIPIAFSNKPKRSGAAAVVMRAGAAMMPVRSP